MLNTDKIRGRLAELRLTQKDVARAMNLSPSTVSQKLSRVRPLNLDEAETLANLLQISDGQFGEYFFYQ